MTHPGQTFDLPHLNGHLQDFDTVFFDLDGTVYTGGREIPGASDLIAGLRESGRRVVFLSNNTSKDKREYVEKLRAIGIPAETSDFVSPVDGLVDFLRREKKERLYVLGTETLRGTFAREGFDPVSDDPELVVVGYDTELTYAKLTEACEHLNRGVPMVATHPDNFCPSLVGPLPDVGSYLAMIQVATGRTAERIFGKPHKVMLEAYLERHGLEPGRCLIVGDRLMTDIHMAHELGMKSLLVLTGDTQLGDLEGQPRHPHYILDSVADVQVPSGR